MTFSRKKKSDSEVFHDADDYVCFLVLWICTRISISRETGNYSVGIKLVLRQNSRYWATDDCSNLYEVVIAVMLHCFAADDCKTVISGTFGFCL